MTRTSSRNDRTAPKIENPRKQNTKKFNTTLRPPQPVGRIVKLRKIHKSPTTQRVKSGNKKEARKPVIPVVTIYA